MLFSCQDTDSRSLEEAKNDLARIEEQLEKLKADAEARQQSQEKQQQDLESFKAELAAKRDRLTHYSFESRRIGYASCELHILSLLRMPHR